MCVHTHACSKALSDTQTSHWRFLFLGEQVRSLCRVFTRQVCCCERRLFRGRRRNAHVSLLSFSWSFPPVTASSCSLFGSPLPPTSVDTGLCYTGMGLLKGSLLAEAPRRGTDDHDAARPTEADALAGPSGVSKLGERRSRSPLIAELLVGGMWGS